MTTTTDSESGVKSYSFTTGKKRVILVEV
jgi:hypothetical protein